MFRQRKMQISKISILDRYDVKEVLWFDKNVCTEEVIIAENISKEDALELLKMYNTERTKD